MSRSTAVVSVESARAKERDVSVRDLARLPREANDYEPWSRVGNHDRVYLALRRQWVVRDRIPRRALLAEHR